MAIADATTEDIARLVSHYGRLDIDENPNPRETFVTGIMDRFNRGLHEDEARELLTIGWSPRMQSSHVYFREEQKYLTFFDRLYEHNGREPVYVYSPKLIRMTHGEFELALAALNTRQRTLVKDLRRGNTDVYRVSDEESLALFGMLSLREVCFSNFFFDACGVVVIGNWELNLPIYAKSDDAFQSCEALAHQVGLYIRQ